MGGKAQGISGIWIVHDGNIETKRHSHRRLQNRNVNQENDRLDRQGGSFIAMTKGLLGLGKLFTFSFFFLPDREVQSVQRYTLVGFSDSIATGCVWDSLGTECINNACCLSSSTVPVWPSMWALWYIKIVQLRKES